MVIFFYSVEYIICTLILFLYVKEVDMGSKFISRSKHPFFFFFIIFLPTEIQMIKKAKSNFNCIKECSLNCFVTTIKKTKT